MLSPENTSFTLLIIQSLKSQVQRRKNSANLGVSDKFLSSMINEYLKYNYICEDLKPKPSVSKKPIDICSALRDLVPFVQIKKIEKHPWRSVNFSKVAGLKRFSRFLNCTNGTKSRNA